MMERTKNKSLYGLIALLAIACVAIIATASATSAFAWKNWDQGDGPIITAEQLAEDAWDANGYRTTIKDGAWGYGVKEHSYSDGITTVKTTGNSSLLNRTELDMTGNKAIKLTFKTSSLGQGLWLTLATQAMYQSGKRLNPCGNENNGMPMSIRLDVTADGVEVYHTEHNGFGSAKTEISGLDVNATHEMYIYAGAGTETDFSFVMVDGMVFKVPNMNVSTFAVDDGDETYYPAYLYFYGGADGQVFELSAPTVVAKPQMYMIELSGTGLANGAIRLDKDEHRTLTYTANANLAAEYPDATYEWTSTDTAVATVDASTGEITAVGGGSAKITCTAKDGTDDIISASCNITVCGYGESGWLTNGNPTTWGGIGIYPETYSYDATTHVTTFDTTPSVMTWNKNALNLDNGPVHFTLNIGAAEDMSAPTWIMFNLMTQAQRDGLDYVKDGNPGKIAFYYNHDAASTETAQVVADDKDKSFPVQAGKDSEVIIYVGTGEEGDTSFVSINGYKIHYTTTLSAFSTDSEGHHVAYVGLWPGKKRTVTVSELQTGDAVILSNTAQSLQVGGTATLTAEVITNKATAPAVTWASSDANVVAVENGVLTAKKGGKATVTATVGSYVATCVVEVSEIEVESVTLDKTTASLKVGETLDLTATYAPSNATVEVEYEWSNGGKTSVATYKVDETDASKVTVTAVGAGIVTVSVDCNGEKAQCIITVTAAEGGNQGGNQGGETEQPEKKGCGGNMAASSIAVALVVLAASAALTLGKKKKASK